MVQYYKGKIKALKIQGGVFLAKTFYLKDFGSDKLESLIDGFRKHILETDRVKSVRSYVGDVKRFSTWGMQKYGSFNITAVSPLDLVEYREHLQKYGGRKGNGAEPSTVNRALISLRVFYEWLKKQGQIRDNPAEDIKPVKENSKPAPRWLDRNQQASLMREVRTGSPRDEAIVGLMLHAGLRVSEVCSLRIGDISISTRSGKVEVTGKGNKKREVPLNSTIRKILSSWLEENRAESLFPNRYGRPISTRGVFKMVAGYAYLAKLEDVTPHTLRHTFCKNAIDRGIPIDQVAMMAGHSSLDVTKRYTAPSDSDLQNAVEKLAWE